MALIPYLDEAFPLTWTIQLIYLALTCVFFAMLFSDETHDRMELALRAYTASCVFSAALGIVGYLDLIGIEDLFYKYGRASGTFQDPNVFGSFLTLGALYLMHGLLNGTAPPALVLALAGPPGHPGGHLPVLLPRLLGRHRRGGARHGGFGLRRDSPRRACAAASCSSPSSPSASAWSRSSGCSRSITSPRCSRPGPRSRRITTGRDRPLRQPDPRLRHAAVAALRHGSDALAPDLRARAAQFLYRQLRQWRMARGRGLHRPRRWPPGFVGFRLLARPPPTGRTPRSSGRRC